MTPDAPVTPRTRGPLIAWAAWDWGSAAFNAVITTFVFTVYLTGSVAADEASGSAALSATVAVAGALVALVAPVWGQRGDAAGAEQGRQRRLGVLTAVTVVAMALLVFVQPSPSHLVLGLGLLAVATFASELSQVEYYALIPRLAPAGRAGRVSGLGWAAGYVGGIVLLAGCLVIFAVAGTTDTSVRAIAVVSAVWFAVFAIPTLRVRFPFDAPPGDAEAAGRSVRGSYALVLRRLGRLWRTDRNLLGFLVSSAIFRDGLTAIFTFGGILAAGTFGLSPSEVIVFAVAANVSSALGAVVGGVVDDRVGPKAVIVVSLVSLVVVAAVLLVATPTATAFWIGGLALSLFLGPAQACSRSYLVRLIPPGREGELFGLYATTGRAASFLAPALFSVFVAVSGEQQWGIAGIGLVLLVGLLTLLPVRAVPGSAGAGGAVTVPGTAAAG